MGVLPTAERFSSTTLILINNERAGGTMQTCPLGSATPQSTTTRRSRRQVVEVEFAGGDGDGAGVGLRVAFGIGDEEGKIGQVIQAAG